MLRRRNTTATLETGRIFRTNDSRFHVSTTISPSGEVNENELAAFLIHSFLSTDKCRVPLGVEDKRITNGQLTASTYYNSNLSPWHGRLNHRWSWSVRTRNNKQWLQVNFQQIYRISGICTQGRQDSDQWVKSYTLTYGLNAMDFAPFKENGRVKVCTVKLNNAVSLCGGYY